MGSALDGKRVLLVDDDPDMITALQALLRDTGAEISTAFDGNQALEMAAEHDPDIIVLDAMLPKRSGFLVLEKIKRKSPDNRASWTPRINQQLKKKKKLYHRYAA